MSLLKRLRNAVSNLMKAKKFKIFVLTILGLAIYTTILGIVGVFGEENSVRIKIFMSYFLKYAGIFVGYLLFLILPLRVFVQLEKRKEAQELEAKRQKIRQNQLLQKEFTDRVLWETFKAENNIEDNYDTNTGTRSK